MFIQHSVRLPLAHDRALRQLAISRQSTPYALLQECVRTGLAALQNQGSATQATADLMREVGMVGAQLAQSERILERALYVACTAAIYGRIATAGRVDESKLVREISEAFERQLRLAGGEQ